MTPERLRSIIESYGSDPGRWPAGERDDAKNLLQSLHGDPAITDLLADAVRVDAALLSVPLPALPRPASASTLLARAQMGASSGWQRALRWLLGLGDGGFSLARPVLAALMPLALGFGAGVALEPQTEVNDDEAVMQVALYAFVAPDSQEVLP